MYEQMLNKRLIQQQALEKTTLSTLVTSERQPSFLHFFLFKSQSLLISISIFQRILKIFHCSRNRVFNSKKKSKICGAFSTVRFLKHTYCN